LSRRVHKARWVAKGSEATKASRESRVDVVVGAIRGFQAGMVRTGLMVIKGIRAQMAKMGLKAAMDVVFKDLKASEDRVDTAGSAVQGVAVDTKAIMAPRGLKASKALWVYKDLRYIICDEE